MAAGDAANETALQRLGQDQRQMRAIGIEIEIGVEIGIGAEFLGQREDAGDVGRRIWVGIGAAADKVGTIRQRRADQRLGFGLVGQPFLDEGAELDIDAVRRVAPPLMGWKSGRLSLERPAARLL